MHCYIITFTHALVVHTQIYRHLLAFSEKHAVIMSRPYCLEPRLSNVARSRNNKYYPVKGLLDGIGMTNKEGREQFPTLLKDHMRWDNKSRLGYTRDEHARLPDSDMSCYGTTIMDNTGIKPEIPMFESERPKAGQYYLLQRDYDMGRNL